MRRKKNNLQGRVVGHVVRFLPQQKKDRGGGVTILKKPKIGAFVTIQVDDKRVYTVPCRASEHLLVNGEAPSEEMHREVNEHLVQSHPFRSEREFVEHITERDKGGPLKRYELVDEAQ